MLAKMADNFAGKGREFAVGVTVRFPFVVSSSKKMLQRAAWETETPSRTV
jgi:hypothetical protein